MKTPQSKIDQLRLALVASLKYHPWYGMGDIHSSWYEFWKLVKTNKKLPATRGSTVGDMFAYWYTELRLNPDDYNEILKMFLQDE